MGTSVGRIEKEFIFKSLSDDGAPCDIHGRAQEAKCRFAGATDTQLTLAPVEGTLPEGLEPGEEIRVFFYLKNNYHTFTARIVSFDPKKLVVEQPRGVYKNLQRKYERVKISEEIEASFSLKGKKIELNFPKSERFAQSEAPELSETFDPRRIEDLVHGFRSRMEQVVSVNKITMLRDRGPRNWEERLVVRLGKCLWIPSTDEDFPSKDPFPDGRIITKGELIQLEEEAGAAPYVVTSKLGNILYEKTKKQVFSELYCPILYNEYVVGQIYLANTEAKRDRISRELVDQAFQFAKALCFSLVRNGYFRAEKAGERLFEATVLDMSASGMLFTHSSVELAREILLHTDMDLSVRVGKRQMLVGARVMRKLKDAENVYFGVLFLRISPEDFRFLFEFLYGKPFNDTYESVWEGGAPPPPVVL